MTVALEKHFRIGELSELWGFSKNTLIKLFQNESGVLRLENSNGNKRRYSSLSIPESVALRVHERLGQKPVSHKPFKTLRTRRDPLRVVSLRDLYGRVPKQPRHIVKSDTAQ